ncbi:hypothetical protein SLS58_002132 [Diplodia intermedia]|uniref:Uncharacterized protein n=1 Tax=Diplodia intermedia TaxID=856260 RepID=A0ABR3TZR0_9PEZI
MCQLCRLVTISERDRWTTLATFRDTVKRAHSEAEAFAAATTAAATTVTNAADAEAKRLDLLASLLDTVKLIRASLDLLTKELELWWKAKAPLRRQFTDTGDEEKLRRSKLVHNSVNAMESDIRAKVGVWVRWGLGVEEGELKVE